MRLQAAAIQTDRCILQCMYTERMAKYSSVFSNESLDAPKGKSCTSVPEAS